MPENLELVNSLSQKLETTRPDLEKFDRYYSGKQPLAYLADEVKAAAPKLFSVAVNWPRLVVGAVEERLDVEGFRTGPDAPADADLWRIWQANNLDESSQQAHAESLVHGRSFAIVWAGPDKATPRISVESAKQVALLRAPGTGTTLAALKRFVDADGYARATLYLPDAIHRYKSKDRAPTPVDQPAYFDPSHVPPAGGWVAVEELPNPLGVVPVVGLVNRARLLAPDGESELADITPLADAINKLATDLMVSAEYHAQPRRWATGFQIAMIDDPDNPGEEIPDPEIFSQAKGRTWLAEDAATKFGQFDEAQLDGFLNSIRTFTHAIASLSGLPPHYIALTAADANPASADAIRSAEASLVSKARRKMRAFGGAWEDVMRLAILVRDGSLPDAMARVETVWKDPETRTVAQAADAQVKLVTAGILPADAALEALGYSPTAIERIREMRRREALDTATLDPAALLPPTTEPTTEEGAA